MIHKTYTFKKITCIMASILGSFKPLQPHGYRLAPDAASPAELGTGGWPWALWCFLAQASPSLCVSLWDVIWTGASVPLTVQVRKPKPLKAQPVSVRAPSEPPCSPPSLQYWFYFEERFESHRQKAGDSCRRSKGRASPGRTTPSPGTTLGGPAQSLRQASGSQKVSRMLASLCVSLL